MKKSYIIRATNDEGKETFAVNDKDYGWTMSEYGPGDRFYDLGKAIEIFNRFTKPAERTRYKFPGRPRGSVPEFPDREQHIALGLNNYKRKGRANFEIIQLMPVTYRSFEVNWPDPRIDEPENWYLTNS